MQEQDLKSEVKQKTNEQQLLEVKGLKTYFYMEGNKVAKAVDGVDFSVKKGETLAIVGESGSGKSITSLSIMRLIPSPPGKIVEGSIELDGKDLLKLSDKEMRKVRGNDIGMIFQEPMTSLNPVFTIGNQISETLMKHKKMKKKEALKKSIDLLKLVGFARAEEIVHEYPHQLSGGMRQRVMIAIAMSCDPKLLIADEPTTALDVTIQAQILDLMVEMKEKFESSILLITHDLGVVAEVSDRVLVMYGGQVVEEATVQELFTNPKHPYTNGLLASIPNIDSDVERLESIPGSVLPAHRFPKGCRFAQRCKHVMDKCNEANPDLLETEANHKVRCYLYED
ncbi:ABC transporter ATP-binding protein [Evansella cellulosilytica]|uniref:Oligopeptide/dipeptide ABC transporter, ATPase subunit n=1 Tax=Evansella cellulosilytica (strain ATCC 21833 / DSM 2522 / FERM P-1141 / JCM 9156 / N-4) TaxID=649639 RepID=E6TRL4_EVAC2|nr:ABC transporter ATP-binding protein [Evansella cellulosilytica]ADU28308.1 oligopeptide/dipeptide ABC transporter, ATPase subunit [Evansella cellulosilytica DSM 2522]